MNIVNIAAYKFVNLTELDALQQQLLDVCLDLNIKGTILLSEEGINLILAGVANSIDTFITHLTNDTRFVDIDFKKSPSEKHPFRRMRVRLKEEIVTMKVPGVAPEKHTGKRISAQQLKQWLDENKEFNFIDTRNDYEIELGTFNKAVDFDIKKFSDYPEVIKQSTLDRSKPTVTFCTGGIRCEKATVATMDAGFEDVYQLDGGILKYFEECGSDHYHGNCFVFDQRTSITSQFAETGLTQCPRCNHFITADEQGHPDYIAWKRCQYCPND